jgi:hypothetical protein
LKWRPYSTLAGRVIVDRWSARQRGAPPGESKAEIEELLDDFGVTQQMTAKGQVNGRVAWLIRFAWQGKSYRFTFVPLDCKEPDKIASFGGKRRSHLEQSEYQMGRIAVNFVKAILTAAEA